MTLLTVLIAAVACDGSAGWNGSLEDLLRSQPERFGTVMQDPEGHRLQVIYTQIDRDAENRPTFRSFRYRVNPAEYFYPASTVKLPTAIVALEKLQRLGLSRDATMLTGSEAAYQTPATTDESAVDGNPSVAQYIRKILLVSDNDAFNRLYEFIGQRELNESLQDRGLEGTRIVHRLEVVLGTEENRWTNPVRFVDGERVLYQQDGVRSQVSFTGTKEELLGQAEIIDGKLVPLPKDFSVKNAYPLQDQHDVLKRLMFPEQVDPAHRFAISDDDYRFLYRWISTYPGESGIPQYANSGDFPEGYVKFLMYGGSAAEIPAHIRIFNKVGDAYGFLTDAAYVVDFEHGIEFLLAATVYTNANQTFNDGEYEYEEIGWPFLRELGQAIYEVELARPRTHRPDLRHLRFEERALR